MNESGQEVVLANLSAKQAKEKGLLTSGTFGLPSIGSLRDAHLRWSLVSKLARKLDWNGLGLYKMTWKVSAISPGRVTFRLQASVIRTSDKDFTGAGWPTPASTDGKGGYVGGRVRNGKFSTDRLDVTVQLAGWATPTATDATRGERTTRETDRGLFLPEQAKAWSGLSARMGSGDLLNPEFPCWLMGIPKELLSFE